MKFKKISFIIVFFLLNILAIAEESKIQNNNTELNIYSGMFDFSDER